MTEEWRAISETHGCYEVSNLGRVIRVYGGVLLKPSVPRHAREYPAVMLRFAGKRQRRQVHDLVIRAFIGPPPFEGAQVRHLDGNHCNPRWDNLAWGTAKQNAEDRAAHGRTQVGERHWCSKLTDEQRRKIGESDEQTAVLAARYGVDRSRIQKIRAAALRAKARGE